MIFRLNLTIRALTYFTQEITAFLLMLVVMSYNGFLIIAIICGATLGYFLFARRTQFIYERQKIMKESAIRGCCPRCYGRLKNAWGIISDPNEIYGEIWVVKGFIKGVKKNFASWKIWGFLKGTLNFFLFYRFRYSRAERPLAEFGSFSCSVKNLFNLE